MGLSEIRGMLLRGPMYVLATLLIMGYIRYLMIIREVNRVAKVFPYPKQINKPMFGGFLTFVANLHRLFHWKQECYKMVEKESGIKRVKTIQMVPHFAVPAYPYISTRDPVMVKHILKDEFDVFVKSSVLRDLLRDFLGRGIFYINHGSSFPEENEIWSFQRKTAAKIFTKNIFEGHVTDTMKRNIAKLKRNIDNAISGNQGEIELKKQVYSFTIDSIGNIGFGVDLCTLDHEEEAGFSKAFDLANYEAFRKSLRPGWKLPFMQRIYPGERRLAKSIKILDDFSYDIIAKRKHEDLEKKGDILSLYIKADPTLNDKFLRDTVMSFMIAGRDTTANTLTFALYLLAVMPNIQDKLFREIDSTFGNDAETTLDDLKKMEYLDGFVMEVLRLFPAVPANAKQASRDDILPNGLHIKKGTLIFYEVYVMGHDEDVYQDAEKVVPERWARMRKSSSSIDPFEFPVFQAGNRICLGKDLALYEVKFFLVQLLREYAFSVPAGKFEGFDPNNVSLRNGKTIYQVAVTLSFDGPLALIAARRN